MITRRMFFAAAAGAASAAADPSVEKGKKFVAEALEALGGNAFLQVRDRVEEGRAYSFYNDKLTGLSRAKIYTRYLETASAQGLAVRERQVFGKDEDNAILFSETGEGWEITFRGARPLPPPTLQRYMDSTPRNSCI
jgi:hypothetical protein